VGREVAGWHNEAGKLTGLRQPFVKVCRFTSGEMKRAADFFRETPSEAGLARVELVLRLAEGEPWTVSFSPGIERFIGHYPRLDEIAPEGTLLTFSRR
jgi:hypothetical protein